MGKTFEIDGISSMVLIYRGSSIAPNKRFKVTMTENELNNFKPYIEIIDMKEVGGVSKTINDEIAEGSQKSAPIVEEKEEIIEQKVENKDEEIRENDKQRNRANSKSKK